jgi:hypothetical protein
LKDVLDADPGAAAKEEISIVERISLFDDNSSKE